MASLSLEQGAFPTSPPGVCCETSLLLCKEAPLWTFSSAVSLSGCLVEASVAQGGEGSQPGWSPAAHPEFTIKSPGY